MTDFDNIAESAARVMREARERLLSTHKPVEQNVAAFVCEAVAQIVKDASCFELAGRSDIQELRKDREATKAKLVDVACGLLLGSLAVFMLDYYNIQTAEDVELVVAKFTPNFRDIMLLNLEERIRSHGENTGLKVRLKKT